MGAMYRAGLCGALMALLFAGCDKAGAPDAPPVPKTPAPAPAQKAKMVPKAGAQPMRAAGSQPAGSQPIRAAGSQPAGSQPIKAAGSQPAGSQPIKAAGSQPAAGHPAPPGGGTLAGSVSLLPDLRDRVKAGTVLFVVVRRDEGEGKRGMLIAAKKIPVTGPDMFPLKYLVTSRDVMMQGTSLWGPVRVDARLDSDGDALSKVPGDITGGPIKSEVGKTDADLELSTVL